MTDRAAKGAFAQDRRRSVAEAAYSDRSEADSKIKGGAVGRLVGGWSRSFAGCRTVLRRRQRAA